MEVSMFTQRHRVIRACSTAAALLLAASGSASTQLAPPPDIVFSAPFASYGFGQHVATDGTVIAALASNGAAAYARTGEIYTWELQDTFAAPDGTASSVAVDDERMVVGQWITPEHLEGVARVFRRSGAAWIEEAVLTPQGGFPGEQFGIAADIDGDSLVIGADLHGPGGAVYVFTRDAGGWSQRALLMAADAAPGDQFGGAVALSGGVLVVGAVLADVGALVDAGAAYVFCGGGATWVQQARLVEPAGHAQGGFGFSVAADGDSVLVGSPSADTPAAAGAGAAYAYLRSGTAWTLQAMLASPHGEAGDGAGYAVALEGDRAVSGAPFADDAFFGYVDAGEAQTFERSAGAWTHTGNLQSPFSGGGFKRLGSSVAVGADSTIAGAPGGSVGTVHVFLEVPLWIELPTWLDLGYDLAGAAGAPRLAGSGTLQAGSPGELLLEHAAPGALALGLVAPTELPTPFKGGTCVPLPQPMSILVVTSGAGNWRVPWNSFPPGVPISTPFYVQFAVADAGAPNGVALSNALAGVIH